MRRFAFVSALVLALVPIDAFAHHKPTHNPPGHSKRVEQFEQVAPVRTDTRDFGWVSYEDPDYGFTIELPLGIFDQAGTARQGVRFSQSGGVGLLDVFGGENTAMLTPEEIAYELEDSPQIADVTYRARGRDWIVLSGYSNRTSYAGDDLIFYAKFMFNAGRTRMAGFEISYPASEKQFFYPLINGLERSLTPPL